MPRQVRHRASWKLNVLGGPNSSRASPLEAEFARLWSKLRGPALEREYRFAPPRRWRFDFAHPQSKVAVEVEGGVWNRGRHNRPLGFIADCEKYTAAALAGWTVVRLTEEQINGESVEKIIGATRGKRRDGTIPTIATTARRRGHVPWAVRRRIWALPCAVCGCEGLVHVDHIVPLCHGGSDDESNLQPLCRICHRRKGRKRARTNDELRALVARDPLHYELHQYLLEHQSKRYFSQEEFDYWRRQHAKQTDS